MVLTIPSNLNDEVQKPFPTDPFYWCWQITIEENALPTPTTMLRIVAADEEVNLGGGLIYYPFPVTHSPIEESGEGDLPRVQLIVDNRRNWLMPYMDQTRGFIGNPVSLRLINRVAATTADAIPFSFHIAKADANEEAVTFQLQIPNPLQQRVPVERFNPTRCDSDFGDDKCGYIRNSVAAFSECDNTIGDCIARGVDERNRRLPVLHPARFGGFRGTAAARR